MFNIRYSLKSDKPFWFTLDRHISEYVFERKVRDKQGYIICDGERSIGILRYSLFWDNTPFVNLIKIHNSFQRKGFGRQAMLHWESEMQSAGYKVVLTSTQADETAQHFYRKLGYTDSGCLMLFNDPAEVFFTKYLT